MATELIYHGVSHSYFSNTVKTIEMEATAKFLGKTYKIRRPVYQPNQEKLNLVYRGVAYSTDSDSVAQPQPLKQSQFVAKLAAQLRI